MINLTDFDNQDSSSDLSFKPMQLTCLASMSMVGMIQVPGTHQQLEVIMATQMEGPRECQGLVRMKIMRQGCQSVTNILTVMNWISKEG
jgi:hypothetical protein